MNGNSAQYYFVSDSSLQSSLLTEKLEVIINTTIHNVTFSELIQQISVLERRSDIVVIIDQNCFSDKQLVEYVLTIENKSLNSKEILINAQKSTSVEELVKLPCAIGLFYQSDNLELMTVGMKKIINGDLWFSRQVANDFIQLFRKQKVYTSNIITDLTGREKEIMNLLSLGASNNEIAEELKVSENTVKTHLHNVFKKIKVRNRLQAVMWTKGQTFSHEKR